MVLPVERVGDIYVKRGDLFSVAGVNGGKAQVINAMAQNAAGLITSGPRISSQIYIGARVAAGLGIPFRCHLPRGGETAEMADVKAHGGEVVQHKAGYNNVLASRAKDDVRANKGWVEVPLWLRGPETVRVIRAEAANIPPQAKRVVVPAGSGMTVAAVLHGLRDVGLNIPVVGVCVGADPDKTIRTFGPFGCKYKLVRTADGYDRPRYGVRFGGIELDPRYEAKCVDHLQAGDCLWVAGHGIHHKKGKH